MTPLKAFISYNKHNVNRFLGVMGLNPNQQQPKTLAKRTGTGMLKIAPVFTGGAVAAFSHKLWEAAFLPPWN